MLKRKDGQLAHVESEYNDIYITKRRNQLIMAFQLKGWDYTESVANLEDADDLPLHYAQVMTLGVAALSRRAQAHPDDRSRRRLDLDLFGRAMPDVAIDTVELDRA